MTEEYNVKKEDLGSLIEKMIELSVKNPGVVLSNVSDSDSMLYQECKNEIKRREKYIIAGVSVILPKRMHLG